MAMPCVNHHEALSSLAPGLVTPCDLPGSNTDGDVWLMSWLLLGFGWLRPQLGHLEPARRHTYLLDDQGIGCPGQGAQRVGFWGLRHGGWWRDDWCGHHMQDVVLDLLCYGHYGILGSCWHIVHQLFFVFHCLPSTLAHKPFGQACHHQGELVQPGLKALTMCQLHLFGHALHPQSQDLPANQPVIVVIRLASFNSMLSKASLIIVVIRVPSGTTKVLPTHARVATIRAARYWVDVTIQLNQLGQQDSAGKPAGDIK